MVIESPVFITLYAISVLWLGSNALTWLVRGHYLLGPGFGIGKSMEPAIPGGLTLYIEHYPWNLKVGDVVSYQHPDDESVNVCHRIVDIEGDRIRIKGDNNNWHDGWFDKGVVIGKLWAPGGRTFYVPLSPYALRYVIDNWRKNG